MEAKEVREKLIEILSRESISPNNFIHNDYSPALKEEITSFLGPFNCVFEDRIIGDGDYDQSQAVYHFSEHDVYLSFWGSYYSEDGMDFKYTSLSDLKVVLPVQIMVTEYLEQK